MARPFPILTVLLAACQPYVWQVPGPWRGEGTPPDEPRLVGARVHEAGAKTCERPDLRDRLGPFEIRPSPGPAASSAYLAAAGILAGDLNGDGQLDLVTPFEPYAKLFRGKSDSRMESWDQRLSGFDLSMGAGGSLADIDGDGNLDLLILRYDRPAVVLRNDGHANFQDVTERTGILADGPSTSSAWGDIDGDGDLDLFVGSYGDPDSEVPAQSHLYENLGGGRFLDRSAELHDQLGDGFTRVGGFHDLDGDGLPELYIVNDVGSVQPNVLLRNVGGSFVRDDAAGLDLALSGGGLGVGDVNGDDVPDFLIPEWSSISLMESDGDGHWFDHAEEASLRPDQVRGQKVGWGTELADMDNDGDLDGLVAYGAMDTDRPDWQNPEEQPDALFLQESDGSFRDVAPEWGIDDPGKNRGFVLADFNADGWLDLVTRDVSGPSTLYLSRCGVEHWVEVQLTDPAVENRNVVGARVRVVGTDGRAWSRWVTAGGTGYGSGGPPQVHFGLGDEPGIERIEVLWPDGEQSWVGYGADLDQRIAISRED